MRHEPFLSGSNFNRLNTSGERGRRFLSAFYSYFNKLRLLTIHVYVFKAKCARTLTVVPWPKHLGSSHFHVQFGEKQFRPDQLPSSKR